MTDRIRSALEKLRPAVFPEAACHEAFDNQIRLADSQWYERERLEQYQLARLKVLLRFAARAAPYWRARLDTPAVESAATLSELLKQLPILTREALNASSEVLQSESLPPGQVRAALLSTSGSTGTVVQVSSTNLSLKWHKILSLRSYLWSDLDFTRSIAFIRRRPVGNADYPAGSEKPRWARRAVIPFPTGPSFQLRAEPGMDRNWEWLRRVRPDYVMTVPSILRGLAECAAQDAGEAVRLTTAVTAGEVVDRELRVLVRDDLGASIRDVYASQEAGQIALQCPDTDGYHVQSEAIVVEVLGDDGRPCGPGEIGRVVVTPLFNFATPLIRYDHGDYAEVGGRCTCGRGLPLLTRIMGRRRNALIGADGRRYWPYALKAGALQKIAPVRKHQFRQVAPDVIEVWLAVGAAVTPAQEDAMRGLLAAVLPDRFALRFRYVSEFPASPGGKHDEFISLLPA